MPQRRYHVGIRQHCFLLHNDSWEVRISWYSRDSLTVMYKGWPRDRWNQFGSCPSVVWVPDRTCSRKQLVIGRNRSSRSPMRSAIHTRQTGHYTRIPRHIWTQTTTKCKRIRRPYKLFRCFYKERFPECIRIEDSETRNTPRVQCPTLRHK